MVGTTLASLLYQDFDEWEALVIDDHSTDRTKEIINQFSNRDSRIIYIKNIDGNKGACSCRNLGIKRSSGKYIVFLDSDDILLPHALKQRKKMIDLCPELDFAVFPGAVFSQDVSNPEFYWNIEKKESDLSRFLTFDSVWSTIGPVWKKLFLQQQHLVWDDKLSIWQDVDFHLNALFVNPNYRVFWKDPYDYLVKSSGADSLSRVNYYSKSKRESRYYFWKKYECLIDESLIKAEWLRPLCFAVYKDSVLNRNWRRAGCVIDEGVQTKVLNNGMKNRLKINLFLNRITRNRAGFARLKSDNTAPGDKTLQRVPIVPSVSH